MARVQESLIPVTEAQQMFVIGSGIAGGVAGWLVAKGFTGIDRVPVSTVVATTVVSVLFTVGAAVVLVKKVRNE